MGSVLPGPGAGFALRVPALRGPAPRPSAWPAKHGGPRFTDEALRCSRAGDPSGAMEAAPVFSLSLATQKDAPLTAVWQAAPPCPWLSTLKLRPLRQGPWDACQGLSVLAAPGSCGDPCWGHVTPGDRPPSVCQACHLPGEARSLWSVGLTAPRAGRLGRTGVRGWPCCHCHVLEE